MESSRSTNEETTTPILLQPKSSVIPDTLLAMAKDSRYIHEMQSILKECFSRWQNYHPHHDNPNTTAAAASMTRTKAWMAAVLLALGLGIRRSNTTTTTTLGMQSVGLHFVSTSKRWKFIAAILSTLSWVYYVSHYYYTSSDRSNNNHHTTAALISSQERLRGNERYQRFQEQRQQMLQRAAAAAAAAAVANNNNHNNNTSFSEDNTTVTTATTPIVVVSQQHHRPSLPSWQQRLGQRLISMWVEVNQSLSNAIQLQVPEGPHIRVGDQLPNTSSLTIGMWILRLPLAYYCFTKGQFTFPSWTFWMSQHPVDTTTTSSSSSSSRSKPLVHADQNDTTLRLVGALMIIQAMVSISQKSMDSLCAWLFPKLMSSQQHQNNQQSSSVQFVSSSSHRRRMSAARLYSRNALCTICRTIRLHPATPSSCGHVFCWNCLYQCLQNVRPECPLCRAPCRPQDIIALYHYEPPANHPSSSLS